MLIDGDSVQDGIIFMFGPMRDIAQYIYSLKHLADFEGKYDEIYPMHGSFPVYPDIIKDLMAGAKEIMDGKAKGIVNIKYIAIHVCEGNKGPKTNNLRSFYM